MASSSDKEGSSMSLEDSDSDVEVVGVSPGADREVEFVLQPLSQNGDLRAVDTPARGRGEKKRSLTVTEKAGITLDARPRNPIRQRLSLEEKAAVVDLLKDKSANIDAIAERSAISRRSVQRIKKKADEISAAMDTAVAAERKKRSAKKPQSELVDSRVATMVKDARKAGLPVTRSTIQYMGKEAKKWVLAQLISTEEKTKLQGMTFGKRWAKNFVARRGIKSIRLHGKDEEEVSKAVLDDLVQESVSETIQAAEKGEEDAGQDEGSAGEGDSAPKADGSRFRPPTSDYLRILAETEEKLDTDNSEVLKAINQLRSICADVRRRSNPPRQTDITSYFKRS